MAKTGYCPIKRKDHQIPSRKKHDEDQLTLGQKEAQDIGEDRIPSTESEGEYRIPPDTKTFQEPYEEACTFDATNGITLLNKQNYKIAIGIGWTRRVCVL